MMRHVLFLCTGNYYRSRFAEELFNHRAELGGLDWIASSRGLALERGSSNVGPVSPYTLGELRDRGILPRSGDRLPRACTIEDLHRAQLVVALDETEHRDLLDARFPEWASRVHYWNIHDVDVSDPVAAVASLDLEITKLIEWLQGGVASFAPAVLT